MALPAAGVGAGAGSGVRGQLWPRPPWLSPPAGLTKQQAGHRHTAGCWVGHLGRSWRLGSYQQARDHAVLQQSCVRFRQARTFELRSLGRRWMGVERMGGSTGSGSISGCHKFRNFRASQWAEGATKAMHSGQDLQFGDIGGTLLTLSEEEGTKVHDDKRQFHGARNSNSIGDDGNVNSSSSSNRRRRRSSSRSSHGCGTSSSSAGGGGGRSSRGALPRTVMVFAAFAAAVSVQHVLVLPAAAAEGAVATVDAPAAAAAATGAADAEGSSAATSDGSSSGKSSAQGGEGGGKRRSKGKKSEGKSEEEDMMDIAERQEWAAGLPVVRERIAYTDVLTLKDSGALKYIIKHPVAVLQAQPEMVLVVMGDDERVVRTVLPPPERDPKFWRAWQSAKMDDYVINAYSPPTKPAEMEPWGFWGPSLQFLRNLGLIGREEEGKSMEGSEGAKAEGKEAKAGEGKKEERKGAEKATKAMSAKERAEATLREKMRRLEEERKAVERVRRQQEQEVLRIRREAIKAEKEERKQREAEEREQRRQEAEEQKSDAAKAKLRSRAAKMQGQVAQQMQWDNFYKSAASNEAVRFVLGVGFFVFFYYGIILNIKKRKKDYEDRVKLEKAAEEERRKLESWEDEMIELEAQEAEEEEKKKNAKKEKDGQQLTTAEMEKEKEMQEAAAEAAKLDEKNEVVKAAQKFMRSGARVKRARRGKRMRRPTYIDLGDEVRFSDVAGLGEIRRELEEVVDFFQSAEKYRRRGSKIPTGILLCGDPGCGKTLLAKAVAGEAGVNFFSVSASQFVEIFVGVGASRVRALYNEARENAPAVVFIDELDAVGRQRGLTEGSGGQERDATLNQLLTCLDGFEGRGDVITIAATNRPDILDAALVRPGRFDRKIYIPKPSLRGRAQILQVHARNKVMADDVDYDVVAEITEGMSGAELANVVDVAALKCLRESRSEISTDDLLQAAVLEEGGYPRQHALSQLRQRIVARNEAAQAVVAYNFPDFKNIQLISVMPRMLEEKGCVRFKLDAVKFRSHFLSATTLRDYVTLQLAPMAADQLWNPPEEWTTIWADHTDAARKMARQLAINGLTQRALDERLYEWSTSSCEMGGRAEAIDEEAERLIAECLEDAREILLRNRGLVDALTDRLVEAKSMQKEEFVQLAEMYGQFDEPRPSLIDIRDKEVAQIRERLMASSSGPSLASSSTATPS